MGIGFGNIDGEISAVLDVVVAVVGQAHDVCAAALAFHHVADHLFIEIGLGHQGDDQGALFDEGDGSVLELAGGKAIANAVRQARQMLEGDVVGKIREGLAGLSVE